MKSVSGNERGFIPMIICILIVIGAIIYFAYQQVASAQQ
jgi:hypothetical protein